MMRVQVIVTNQFGVFKSAIVDGAEAELLNSVSWEKFATGSIQTEDGKKFFFPENVFKSSLIEVVKIED
jgi:hypothetical protein